MAGCEAANTIVKQGILGQLAPPGSTTDLLVWKKTTALTFFSALIYLK
jgi:hypothetical protein